MSFRNAIAIALVLLVASGATAQPGAAAPMSGKHTGFPFSNQGEFTYAVVVSVNGHQLERHIFAPKMCEVLLPNVLDFPVSVTVHNVTSGIIGEPVWSVNDLYPGTMSAICVEHYATGDGVDFCYAGKGEANANGAGLPDLQDLIPTDKLVITKRVEGPPPSPKKTSPKQAVYVLDVKSDKPNKDLLLGIVAPAPTPKAAPAPAKVTRATVAEATANTVAAG